MGVRLYALMFAIATSTLYGQNSRPITRVEACRQFSKAIVQVDTDYMHGSGFVVDPDGWIVTALHVVADRGTLKKYGGLTLDGVPNSVPAEVVSPIDQLARTRDFAVLKIDKSALRSLQLGNEDDAPIGSDIAVIGFPLSAAFPHQLPHFPKFCLFGTVAAQDSLPIGERQHLDTIYFQGVSIQGISGAPIISLDSGEVIGIVSTKLTGIGNSLAKIQNALGKGGAPIGVAFKGVGDIGKFAFDITNVLDTQLANGLGSGTGAADAKYALAKAKREYEHDHPKK